MTTQPSADNPGYFETIQQCFTELTRRAIFLSGRDLQILETWREQGATATAVCKGLREAVEAMPDDDPPRDVYACRHYIEPYVERARERQVGGRGGEAADTPAPDADTSEPDRPSDGTDDESSDAASANPLLEQALSKIEQAGRAADDDAVKQVYRRAWREIRDLWDDPDAGLERLAAVEEGLVDGYYRTLDRDEQEEIAEAIESKSGDLLERMSPDARREHMQARRRRILMEQFDLISLLE
jgi:hypothetical protein